ncbi:MAG: type II toxin-antitoxin system PemK/MazF family toxin [Pseudomonadota bacterium]|nr:type II toxin-antitoxin system PemK/MazF family toxin [Pseudomonadota bacterium]
MGMVKRFDVYLCDMYSKLRPCVILSPDEMNTALPYVLMAPITTNERLFPSRVGIRLKGRQGQVALDMMRTVLQSSLKEKIGTLPENTRVEISDILKRMFTI